MNDKGEIIIYQSTDGTPEIEVKVQDETVWLTQGQLVELYQTSKSNISEPLSTSLKKASWRSVQLFGNSEQLPQTAKAIT